MAVGSFSNSGLSFGLSFVLEDMFSDVAEKIKGGMGQLDTAVDSAAESIKGAFGKVAAGTAMIASGIGMFATFKKALDARSEMEQFEGQLAGFVGGIDNASAVIANIRDDFKKAPVFDLASTVAANRDLLTTLKYTGDEARGVVNNIQNAVAALGGGESEVERLTTAMVMAKNEGVAGMRQIMMMRKMGLPVYEMLADSMGVSIEKVKELAKEQKLTAEDFEKTFAKAAESGGRYAGALERMSGTIAAMRKRISEAFSYVFEQVGGALEPVFAKLTKVIVSVLDAVGDFLATPFGKVISWIVGIGVALAAVALIGIGVIMVGTAIKTAFIAAAAAVWAALWPVLLIVAIIAVVVAAFYGLWKAVDSNNKSWQQFAIIAFGILGPIGWIVGAIMFLAKGFKELNNFMGQSKQSWDEYSKTLSPITAFFVKVAAVLKAVGEMFKYSSSEGFAMTTELHKRLEQMGILDFVEMIGEWIMRIKAFFEGFMEGVKPIWETIKSVWKPLKEAIKAIFDIISPLGKLFKSTGDDIGNTTPVNKWIAAGKLLGSAITIVVKVIVFAIKIVLAIIEVLAKVIKGAVEYIIVPVLQFLWKIIKWVIGLIVGQVKLLIAGFRLIVDSIKWLWNNWQSIWGLVVDFFKWVGSKIWEGVQWIWDKFLDFIHYLLGLPGKLINWGKDIITSMLDGLKTHFPKLFAFATEWVEKITGLFGRIKDGIKKAWNWLTGGGDDANVNVNQISAGAVTSSGSVVPMPTNFSPESIGTTMAQNLGQQYGSTIPEKTERQKLIERRTEQVTVNLNLDGDQLAGAVINQMDFKKARDND